MCVCVCVCVCVCNCGYVYACLHVLMCVEREREREKERERDREQRLFWCKTACNQQTKSLEIPGLIIIQYVMLNHIFVLVVSFHKFIMN